ncbi:serine/threonine protein kinase [Lignipirellula cremea]|uniref:Serine/threonine-protein kinase PknB n=1 Tax=Lignipirellula cremea TaxID=2528010 RepID=A0A518DWY5_9BACT|nr:serine/threonine-protein kinase [Lignipirellula cremea]QDU96334.1 Serine/threonine-protein kinase PknB [Lignipirellula cremea]
MSFLEKLKTLFKSDKVDISARFEFSREAISGTMSKFRKVFDIENSRTVGLKVLDSEKTEHFEARFKGLNKPSEGAIAMLLKHPQVVETYEHGVATSGVRYIVMEYIEGSGLNQMIQNRDSGLNGKRVSLMRQMALGVGAVHKAGFIHRDVCPRNFIVSADYNTAKLIDFGLTVPNEPPYRQPGNRTGTPLYMSPEIVRRRATDHRVDIFALGVTLYRLFVNEHPWSDGDATGKAALSFDTQAPTSILERRPRLNPAIASIIMQCLQPDPNKRPETAERVAQAISGIDKEDQ